jgi:hypothetical protein
MSKYFEIVPITEKPEKTGLFIFLRGDGSSLQAVYAVIEGSASPAVNEVWQNNGYTHYLKPIEQLPLSREQAQALVNALGEIRDLAVSGKRYSIAYDNAREIALKALANYKESAIKEPKSLSREQAEKIWDAAYNRAYYMRPSNISRMPAPPDREEYLKQFS